MDFIFLSLLSILLFVFGINNGAVLKSSLVSSGLYTNKRSSLIVTIGLVFGSLFESWKMKKVMMISSSKNLTIYYSYAIFLTFILLFLLTYIKSPGSIAQILFSSLLGILIAKRNEINFCFLSSVVVSWFVNPVISIIVSFIFYKLIFYFIQGLSLTKISKMGKFLSLISTFYISYSLGANNIGLLIAPIEEANFFIVLVLSLIASFGVYFGKSIVKSLGEDLIVISPIGVSISLLSSSFVVWFLTQFGLPSSITTSVMSSIIGIGLASRVRIFNLRKLIDITIISWAISAIIGLVLGNIFAIYAIS